MKEDTNLKGLCKDNVFGRRVSFLLERMGITQRELAADIGITEVSVSRYINGIRFPKMPVINAIVRALNTSADYLLGLDLEQKDGLRWVPLSEGMPPEGIINPFTNDYRYILCTCVFRGEKDVRVYKFGNGHFWNGPGIVDEYVIAWMEMPPAF